MRYQLFDRMTNPSPNFPIYIEDGAKAPLLARAGEEYSFCVGVEPKFTEALTLSFSDFQGEKDVISKTAMFSINFGGTDYRGEAFEKEVIGNAGQGFLFWVTVLIPQNAAGEYSGTLHLEGAAEFLDIPVTLTVEGTVQEYGWWEPEKITRLSWLNSARAQKGGVTAPYTVPTVNGRTVMILGRDISVNDVGMPWDLISHFDKNIQLSDRNSKVCDGVDLVISPKNGGSVALSDFIPDETEMSVYGEGFRFRTVSHNDKFTAAVITSIEYDGFIGVSLDLCPKEDMELDDISLTYTMNDTFDRLMMGLGKEGGSCPDCYDFKWNCAKRQNPLWIGGIHGGLRCELKGENFREPFVNIYYRHRQYRYSESFANPKWGEPQGGITLRRGFGGTAVRAYSGKRTLKSGHVLSFDFDLLFTPLKPLDMKKRMKTRYYHGGDVDVDAAATAGASHVICHHASKTNPYINYPFLTVDKIRSYIDKAHSYGMGAKLYYTLREHSDHTKELNAEMSLGEEIYPAPAGGQESILWDDSQLADFVKTYGKNRIPGWVTDYDMSMIADGQSRLCNYYIEGLHWMCEKYGLDGIYVDDMAYDRYTIRRARRVLDEDGRDKWEGIGCAGPRVIDLHTWNHYCDLAGYGNCLNMYMPLLPYIDSVWMGEAFFHMEVSPEYWLTEIAPIPFGEPTEMLDQQKTPLCYRAMQFGATKRMPWEAANDKVDRLWAFMDRYGLPDSLMVGFWNDESPAKTGTEEVKVTAFLGEEYAVLALASWTDRAVTVFPTLEDERYDMSRAFVPAVEGFQEETDFRGFLTVEKDSGYLVVVPKK